MINDLPASGGALVVRVPLLLLTVVLVVEVLGVLLGMVVGLDLVVLIETLGFDELVDLGASEAGEELLGEGVGDGLAYLRSVSLVVLSV
jgi:hypothetical protein